MFVRRLLPLSLLVLILLLLRPFIASVALNNFGSLLLNRALLSPGLAQDERTELAARAGRAFAAAAAWRPDSALPYYNLATIYSNWGDGPSAVDALARATARGAGDVSARFAYGQALAAEGDEAGAREAWRAARAEAFFVASGSALAREGDRAGALAEYQRAVAIAPESPKARYQLGLALAAVGRREEAVEALETAAALEPASSPRRYLLQGEVHVARGEWVAALAAYGQAAALAPADPAPHYRMGALLQGALGDEAEAIAHYEWAVQLDPGTIPARLALGALYGERGECDHAAAWLSPLCAAEAGDSTAAEAHFRTGACLAAQDRTEEGLPHLARAAALRADSAGYARALASAYSRVGRYREAIEAFRRVLELAPGDAGALRALDELGVTEP